jgi:hypothetical protein
MKATARKKRKSLAVSHYWYGCIVGASRYRHAIWHCEHEHSTDGQARACAKRKLIELSATEKVSA